MNDEDHELPLVTVSEEISYVRHEYHHEPQEASGNLLSLIYDIPYFGGCGVFPPLHVINQQFASGGGDGGMSPGASWSAFSINRETYAQLLAQVRETDPSELEGKSRYIRVKFIEDSAFDAIQDWFEWSKAACKKYRDWYLREHPKDVGT